MINKLVLSLKAELRRCMAFCFIMCYTVGTLAALWKKSTSQGAISKAVFHLPQQNEAGSIFKMKYDKIQQQLQHIAAMDDLLSGSQTHICVRVHYKSVHKI